MLKTVADITSGAFIKPEMKVYIKCNVGFSTQLSVLLLYTKPLMKMNEKLVILYILHTVYYILH